MANGKGPGVRYSDAQKKKILESIANYDKKHGSGGTSHAMAKYKVSYTAIKYWRGGETGKSTTKHQPIMKTNNNKKVIAILKKAITALSK